MHGNTNKTDYLKENADTGRVMLPDLVRSFALIGIVLVNVAYFAYPSDITYHVGGLNSALDNGAYFGVNALFFLKSYTLFSFMFGVGLAFQILSAERRNQSFAVSHWRRMAALIAIGILHVTFAFTGDILIVYGILGSLLYFFRNKSPKALVKLGVILVIVQVIVATLFTVATFMGQLYAPDQMTAQAAEMDRIRDITRQVFQQGSLMEVAALRWQAWFEMMIFLFPLQGPGALGFFLFGLAAVRTGILSDPGAPLWSKARRFYLPIGVIISAVGAYLSMHHAGPLSATSLLGLTLLVIGAPLSSVGYIGIIAKWSQGAPSPLKVFLARGGTASLTAYLMQSLILSWIFCGYGLGLYASRGAFVCIVIALVTGVASIVFVSLWRKKFKRGPAEVLLRKWSYLGR